MAPRMVSFALVFYNLSEKLTFTDFQQRNKVFDLTIGIPSQKSDNYGRTRLPMVSMETKVMSRDSFLDKLSEKLYLNGF